jgi:hypothetical protein
LFKRGVPRLQFFTPKSALNACPTKIACRLATLVFTQIRGVYQALPFAINPAILTHSQQLKEFALSAKSAKNHQIALF